MSKCGEHIDYSKYKISDIVIGLIVFIPFLAFLFVIGGLEWGESFAISLVLAIVIGIVVIIQENNRQLIKNECEEKRELFFLKHQVPRHCKQFEYFGGYSNLSERQSLYLWVEHGFMNILPMKVDAIKYQIPIKDIVSFSTKGDLRLETEIEGNDPSLIGTMIAEQLFGTAAAIKSNQQIPKIKNVDERKTIINANIDGESKFIIFEKADVYNYLLETIPEKELSYVSMKNNN